VGFVLDLLSIDLLGDVVVFFARTLLRVTKEHNTRAWPTAEAVIQESGCSQSSPNLAEVTYTYSVNDERHFGRHKRKFILDQSAKEYVKRYIPGWKLVIRHNGKDHDNSFVSDRDQVIPPAWATRYR